ncbi:aldo/keto reductase [Paenibacillus marinisediminis]
MIDKVNQLSGSMPYINIDGLKLPCSRLVLGSTMLSLDRLEASMELLDAYAEIGGNMIDSAHIYGESSAKALGLWLKERQNRDSIMIIGKGAHFDGNGPRVNREAITEDLLVSLERMQLEAVDVYMLHRDDPEVPVGAIMEWLHEQVESGRCQAIGVSNWTTARIQAANEYAERNGLTKLACNSPNLSLAVPNEPRWKDCVSASAQDIEWHSHTQLPLLSWSSQAGGFFTGRFSPDKREDPEAVRVYYSDDNWERYARAEELAKQKGTDANQIALAYVLNQPFPTCALIGPYQVAELMSSFRAVQISLTPQEMAWLNLQTASIA